jgi:hypothetical protein
LNVATFTSYQHLHDHDGNFASVTKTRAGVQQREHSSSRPAKGELQRSGKAGLEPPVASIVRQACGPEWIGRSPKTH